MTVENHFFGSPGQAPGQWPPKCEMQSWTDLRPVQCFIKICSAVSSEMCPQQTDRQTDKQQIKYPPPHYDGGDKKPFLNIAFQNICGDG